MNIVLDFEHDYEVSVPDELPSDSYNTFWINGLGADTGRDSLVLQVSPHHGSRWTGVFGGGHGDLKGCWAMPSPKHLLVCSAGTGYIVDSTMPGSWEQTTLILLNQVVLDLGSRTLLIASDTEVAAYSRSGFKWCSERLSLDGVKIESVGKEAVNVLAYTPKTHSWNNIRLSLDDGKIVFTSPHFM